jgi:hypothetical protein
MFPRGSDIRETCIAEVMHVLNELLHLATDLTFPDRLTFSLFSLHLVPSQSFHQDGNQRLVRND